MKYILWSLALLCLVSCGDNNPNNTSSTNSTTEESSKGSYTVDEASKCINLTFANGKTANRCDVPDTDEGNPDTKKHSVQEYFEAQQYLALYISYFEGSDVELINLRNGNSKKIGAKPILSPKGTKVALAQTDLMAGYGYNGFRVYDLGEDGPTLLKEIVFPEWGAQNAQWVDDKTVTFDIMAMDHVGDADIYKLRDTTIRF